MASGTMTVSPAGGYSLTDTKPDITMPPGTTFLLGIRMPSASTLRQQSNIGVNTPFYWSGDQPPRRIVALPFAYAVVCAGRPVAPVISGNAPQIGSRWTITLSQARPNAPSSLLIGTRRAALAIPATNSCFLNVIPPVAIPGNTSSAGIRNVSLTVGNDIALCGAKLQAQYSVAGNPPGNLLGVISTQGREGTIGR